MLQATIKIDDLEMYKNLCKQKASVEVGYFKDKVYDAVDEPFYANVAMPNTKGSWGEKVGKPRKFGKMKAITAEEVAMANEFGGPKRPARPFMRFTFKYFHKLWVKYVQDYLPQTMDVKETFKDLGMMIKEDISDNVNMWWNPPNAPSTIARKGFNNPLVDSGNMAHDFIQVKLDGVDVEK